MEVLLINEKGASFIDIPNTNEAINQALGWEDYWDCPNIKVGNLDYVVICADTGKMRHEPVSAIGINNFSNDSPNLLEPFIVGAIIITKFDGTDDFMTLNQADKENLAEHIFEPSKKSPMFYPSLLIID